MTNAQKTPVETLEENKRRHASLKERHTRVHVKLEAERQALEDAKANARAQFGTDDLAQLREMFRARQGENEQKVFEFVLALDEVDRKLTDIERQVSV